jgi:hypothetical protein
VRGTPVKRTVHVQMPPGFAFVYALAASRRRT